MAATQKLVLAFHLDSFVVVDVDDDDDDDDDDDAAILVVEYQKQSV